jgi:hypothetical protein
VVGGREGLERKGQGDSEEDDRKEEKITKKALNPGRGSQDDLGDRVLPVLPTSCVAWLSGLSDFICEMGPATSALTSRQGSPEHRRPGRPTRFRTYKVLFNLVTVLGQR